MYIKFNPAAVYAGLRRFCSSSFNISYYFKKGSRNYGQ